MMDRRAFVSMVGMSLLAASLAAEAQEARKWRIGALDSADSRGWAGFREGQPGYLGEREPLDNPEPIHGVCARHKVELLESLPSRSFPDAELLVIVRRDRTLLYEQLAWLFAATRRVKVILDRRVADEPRHERTRRIRAGTVSPLGDFMLVRFTPKTPRLSAYTPGTIVPEHLASGAQRFMAAP